MPCKRSSAAPIPFGFQLSVARSRRFALPVTARSAPCGFVPLRQSRRNTVLRTPSYGGTVFVVGMGEIGKASPSRERMYSRNAADAGAYCHPGGAVLGIVPGHGGHRHRLDLRQPVLDGG